MRQVCESDFLVNQGHSTRTREWWSRSTTARRCRSGLVLVRQLIERLGVASAIDVGYECAALQVVPGIVSYPGFSRWRDQDVNDGWARMTH